MIQTSTGPLRSIAGSTSSPTPAFARAGSWPASRRPTTVRCRQNAATIDASRRLEPGPSPPPSARRSCGRSASSAPNNNRASVPDGCDSVRLARCPSSGVRSAVGPHRQADRIHQREKQYEACRTMGDWCWGTPQRETPGGGARVCRAKRRKVHPGHAERTVSVRWTSNAVSPAFGIPKGSPPAVAASAGYHFFNGYGTGVDFVTFTVNGI